jgi:glycosidase
MARVFSVLHEDLDAWKMELAWLATIPRIPQFYYGTEILMTSDTSNDDGSYRDDFPGGWAGDKLNAFTGAGLSARQREAQAFVRKLLNWRKQQPVIHHGKTMQFGAEDDTYVYFRYDDTRKVMVALNAGKQGRELPTARFHEMLAGVQGGTDVLTGAHFDLRHTLKLAPRSAVILELE